MLNNPATNERWWRKVLVFSLLILGLVEVGLPRGRAELRYNGGYVQTRRRPNDSTLQKSAPKTTTPAPPKTTSSYSPDNDLASYASTASGESERPIQLPSGVSSSALPWNREGFKDYDEAVRIPTVASYTKPRKYELEVATVRPQPRGARTGPAGVIAHLPEHALLWVEDTKTRLTGRTRYFQSPPLPPDRKYSYRVRAVWIEDGRWVSQTQTVPVASGGIEAVYLQRRPH